MTDVFVSYSNEDCSRVEPLVRTLRQRGWSVFWDRDIPPGETWETYIATQLNDSRCVLVLWSRHSVKSDFVIIEAGQALKRRILVPALLDRGVEPPLRFTEIQAANLIEFSDLELKKLITAVDRKLSTAPVSTGGGKDAASKLTGVAKKSKAIQSRLKTIEVRVTFEGGDELEIRFRPSQLHLRKDEMVDFLCYEGTLDVVLEPADAYTPSRFRTGDPPVLVTKSAKGNIWFGGTFHASPHSATKSITIDPSTKQYGVQNDPPPES